VNIIKIFDKDKFQEYIKGHIPTMDKYGGKFLVKGYTGEVLEGEWNSNLIVIHEFPSINHFKEWYHSEEYQPWKELRQLCAEVNVILTEGV